MENKESDRMCSVNDPAHDYELHNIESGVQNIKFIKKEKVSPDSEELVTIHDGTTNEAVIQVLIHRLSVLNERCPSAYNEAAIRSLEEAYGALEARTAERKSRGVEGTHQL